MKNILIIDDEEKLRQLLARIIKSEGFDVFEAPDLKSGFKKLEQNDIDVVLCDVKLPDGNGVDFLQKIKAGFPSFIHRDRQRKRNRHSLQKQGFR